MGRGDNISPETRSELRRRAHREKPGVTLSTRIALPEDLRAECAEQLDATVWARIEPHQVIVCHMRGVETLFGEDRVNFACTIELTDGPKDCELHMRRLRWDLLSNVQDLKRAMELDRQQRITGVGMDRRR